MTRKERKALAARPCERSTDGRHAWWGIMRFPWPWGVVFPDVVSCLYCEARR